MRREKNREREEEIHDPFDKVV